MASTNLAGRLLKLQAGYNGYVVRAHAQGLTQAESLARPEAGGNSLNWVLGHITNSRADMLALFGETTFDAARYAHYKRGESGELAPADAKSIEDILADFESTEKELLHHLETVTDRRLAEPAQGGPRKDENETVGTMLAFLIFHETYHAGQIAILRRFYGKDGIIK